MTVIGILLTFFILLIFFEAKIYDEKGDINNWVGLIVEIGVAVGITVAVWIYTKNQQNKTNDLLKNIHKLTEKLDKVIKEENHLQTSRKKFLHECLFGDFIQTITSAYNITNDKPIQTLVLQDGTKVGELSEYQMLSFVGKTLDERILQFGSLMDPELYASTNTVRNLLHGSNIGKLHMKSIIDQSKRGIRALDTSLFSTEHINGIDILDKV